MPLALIRLLLAAAIVSLSMGCSSSSSDSSGDDDDDAGTDVPTSPTAFGAIRFNEVMANPDSLSESQGEWFEVRNPTSSKLNLRNCVFSNAATNNFTVNTDLQIIPGGLRTFAVSASPGFTPDYDYSGSGLTLNNNGDTLTLTCNGITIDTRTYAAAVAQSGRSSALSRDGNGKWCFDLGNLYNGDTGTPGAANVICA